MTPDSVCFDRFTLDRRDRRLRRDGVAVELNGRYLDALMLLVAEAGRLVSKDRFLDEVWRGVPVTDEALTQCIKSVRRALDDDAARPRFIETVPKHGYRFIAEVAPARGIDAVAVAVAAAADGPDAALRRFLLLGGAGTVGGVLAGALGGLFYGFASAAPPLAPGVGAASVLLVVLWLSIAAALMGGAGVSFGIAAADRAIDPRWRIVGGALGGLVVGGAVKLLGLDAFNLLLGRSPGDITGAFEGALLGGGVGVGAWMVARDGLARSVRRQAAIAALAGGIAGIIITLTGGRLMAGSLDLLARNFSDSRLNFASLGAWFGERGLGPVSMTVTGALEGALFAAGIVVAMTLARRSVGAARDR